MENRPLATSLPASDLGSFISKDNEQILWEVNLINAAKGRLQEIGIKIAKGAMSVGRSFPVQSPALRNSKGDRSR